MYEFNIQDIFVFILIVDTNLEHEQPKMGKNNGGHSIEMGAEYSSRILMYIGIIHHKMDKAEYTRR
jgi:hypothetical protein